MSKCCGCMALSAVGTYNQVPWRDPELDRIIEMIRQHGGNVNAEVLITLVWHSESDLDMHLFVPEQLTATGDLDGDRATGEIYYNRHNISKSQDKWNTGYLDIDMNAGGRITTSPVENIGFLDVTKMPNGHYMFSVNQYNNRGGNGNNKFTVLLAFKDKGSSDFTKVLVMDSKFSLDPTNKEHSRNNGGMYDIFKFKVTNSENGSGKNVLITWLNGGGFNIKLKRDIAFSGAH